MTNSYITDNHALYQCDNMGLMKQYPDKWFDVSIVDVPYGIGEDGLKNHSRSKIATAKKYIPKDWDSKSPDKSYFDELIRVSKNQIIWGANHFISKIPYDSSCWIVWDKDNSGNFADCELAWTSFDTAVRKFQFRWNGMLQGDMKNKEHRIHVCQISCRPLLRNSLITTCRGQRVFDSHLGSCSIAIATHDLGFHLTGCELDADYFRDGIQRVKNHVAQKQLF